MKEGRTPAARRALQDQSTSSPHKMSRLVLREVHNFGEFGHNTEIVSGNMDFAVISVYSDNLLIVYFGKMSLPLRVEKKSNAQGNAING